MQKLHDEGAAGFAAGPWSIGDGSAATGPTVRDWRASIRSGIRHFGITLRIHSEPILSGLAMLSIAAIIVGIIGVNLTEEPGEQLVAARVTGSAEAPPSQPDGSQLTDIKRKIQITTHRLDTLAAEFRRLRHRANTVTTADERRLQALENKLVLTVSRMDILSAEILDLKNANNMILASTKAAPPAAAPVEARAPTRSRPHSMPSSQAKPAALFGQEQPQRLKKPVPTPIAAASPAPEPVPVPIAIPPPSPDPEPEPIATVNPTPDPKPVPVAAANPAPDSLPAPAQITRTVGGWVVNLASYNRQKTADRYVAELQQSGIRAERAEATVNGKIMHRVRVAGFDNYSAAKARAGTLKQELDLPGIWIAKR
ncbi:MAG: hypothetical protein HKM88_01210 [Halobacteria archaeon]|nr:hypothetical protein [Halobacteria archaeon]